MSAPTAVVEDAISIATAQELGARLRLCVDMFGENRMTFRTTNRRGVPARVFKKSHLGRCVRLLRRVVQRLSKTKFKTCTIVQGPERRRKKPTKRLRSYIVLGGARMVGASRVSSRSLCVVQPGVRADVGQASKCTLASGNFVLEFY